jgi:hypothetical protein
MGTNALHSVLGGRAFLDDPGTGTRIHRQEDGETLDMHRAVAARGEKMGCRYPPVQDKPCGM